MADEEDERREIARARLKAEMLAGQWTPAGLGKAAGVDPSQISRAFHGNGALGIDTARKVARVLNRPFSWIVAVSDERGTAQPHVPEEEAELLSLYRALRRKGLTYVRTLGKVARLLTDPQFATAIAALVKFAESQVGPMREGSARPQPRSRRRSKAETE